MKKELMEALIDAPQCLTAQMEASGEPGERRRDVLFYSGAKVPRMDWMTGEEYDLSFSMDGANLTKLADGPVLNGHSIGRVDDVLGIVENPRKSTRGYEATLRFSDREDVAGTWADIESGILRSVSMGVSVKRLILAEDDKKRKRKHYMATEWEPFEISVVPRGADPGAKFLSMDPRIERFRAEQVSVDTGAASEAEKNEALAKIAILRHRHAR